MNNRISKNKIVSLIVLLMVLLLLSASSRPRMASAQIIRAETEQTANYDHPPRAMTEQAKLTAADGAASDQFGNAAALSNDGNIAVVGAAWKGFIGGAAYIFVRNAGAWSQQQKIPGGTEGVNFGYSVSISGDGNTIAIGDPSFFNNDHSAQPGAVIVFTRSGTTYTQQDVLRGGGGTSSYGRFVGMSNDGSTLVVSSWNTVDVFTKSGSTWIPTRLALLSGTTGCPTSVAINGNGSVVVVGECGTPGAVYVYDRPVAGWSGTVNQSAILTAGEGAYWDAFGYASALSSDGNTVAVGARQVTNGTTYHQGAVYAFTRTSGTWSQPQKMVASDRGTENAELGATVTISGDGTIIAAAAPADSSDDVICGGVMCQWHGSAYTYARAGGTWVEQQKLMASDKAFDDQAGFVTISSDGGTLLFGVSLHDVGGNSNQGTAYIFVGGRTVYLPLILR